jgi:hypothetical protein
MKDNFERQIEVCLLCTVEVGEIKISSLQQTKAYCKCKSTSAPPASTTIAIGRAFLCALHLPSPLPLESSVSSTSKELGRWAWPRGTRPPGRSTMVDPALASRRRCHAGPDRWGGQRRRILRWCEAVDSMARRRRVPRRAHLPGRSKAADPAVA